MKLMLSAGSSSTSSSSSMTRPTKSTSKAALSEVQKQERRDMVMRAAKEREQQWDKRKKGLASTGEQVDYKGRPLYDHSAAAALGSSNPETQRMVEKARQAEEAHAAVRPYLTSLRLR